MKTKRKALSFENWHPLKDLAQFFPRNGHLAIFFSASHSAFLWGIRFWSQAHLTITMLIYQALSLQWSKWWHNRGRRISVFHFTMCGLKVKCFQILMKYIIMDLQVTGCVVSPINLCGACVNVRTWNWSIWQSPWFTGTQSNLHSLDWAHPVSVSLSPWWYKQTSIRKPHPHQSTTLHRQCYFPFAGVG